MMILAQADFNRHALNYLTRHGPQYPANLCCGMQAEIQKQAGWEKYHLPLARVFAGLEVLEDEGKVESKQDETKRALFSITENGRRARAEAAGTQSSKSTDNAVASAAAPRPA